MSFQNLKEKIIIIDFGSQVTKLIGRRIRDFGVFSEILTIKDLYKIKNYKSIKGIILSGGPATVTKKKYPNIPKEIFLKILDDETSNKMPLDIIEEAKKSFNERFQNLDWEIYYKDLPFNPSALSLYKWAPIAEELKSLDRKIVLNSMILKWDIVKQEFERLIEF